MRGEKWNKQLKNSADFIGKLTNQEIEKIMITKYDKRGAEQPYHSDLNESNKPTQLTNVSIGPKRELEIIHKYIKSWKRRLTLQEGRIYVFTHLFNKYFKHRYIHQSNNINYSLTYRSEI